MRAKGINCEPCLVTVRLTPCRRVLDLFTGSLTPYSGASSVYRLSAGFPNDLAAQQRVTSE